MARKPKPVVGPRVVFRDKAGMHHILGVLDVTKYVVAAQVDLTPFGMPVKAHLLKANPKVVVYVET